MWMVDIDTKCEDTLKLVKLRLPDSSCVPIQDTEVIKHCITLLYKN